MEVLIPKNENFRKKWAKKNCFSRENRISNRLAGRQSADWLLISQSRLSSNFWHQNYFHRRSSRDAEFISVGHSNSDLKMAINPRGDP